VLQGKAIVVNLEHVKAIIKSDEFVLFDSPEADNSHQSLFVFDLQERLRVDAGPEGLPYELRSFEAILVSVSSVLRDQLQKLSPKVFSLLRRLETNSRIDRDTLLDVLDLSKKLTKFDPFFVFVFKKMLIFNNFFLSLSDSNPEFRMFTKP